MGFLDSISCLMGSHDWCDWAYQSTDSCFQKRKCQKCSKNEERTHHDLIEYRYILEDSCEQHESCKRCPHKKIRLNHASWSEWSYLLPDKKDCRQARMCYRCRAIENCVEHCWNAWNYESPTSCIQISFCYRCDQKGINYPDDKDHKWITKSEYSCTRRTQICKRCSEETEDFSAKHKWGKWYDTENKYIRERKCLKCPQTEYMDTLSPFSGK